MRFRAQSNTNFWKLWTEIHTVGPGITITIILNLNVPTVHGKISSRFKVGQPSFSLNGNGNGDGGNGGNWEITVNLQSPYLERDQCTATDTEHIVWPGNNRYGAIWLTGQYYHFFFRDLISSNCLRVVLPIATELPSLDIRLIMGASPHSGRAVVKC